MPFRKTRCGSYGLENKKAFFPFGSTQSLNEVKMMSDAKSGIKEQNVIQLVSLLELVCASTKIKQKEKITKC